MAPAATATKARLFNPEFIVSSRDVLGFSGLFMPVFFPVCWP
jgi:hypothetical protein